MDKRQEENMIRSFIGTKTGARSIIGIPRDYVEGWQACLDANGIGEEKKSWQANRDDPINRKGEVPYGGLNAPTLIDLMREISASVKDIAKKLEPEVVNVEAKKPVWKDRELMDFLEMAQGFIQTEK